MGAETTGSGPAPVPHPYPVNLALEGRVCLVVGGGDVADQKVDGLRAAGARVTVVAPRLGGALAERLKTDDELSWQARPYRDGEVAGYRLAITATDDRGVNRQVFTEGEAAGVLVNSADDPANCAFTLPSVVRRGPLLVTFATGGASPAMATWLRRRFTDELGPEYVTLIDLLAQARARLRAEGRSTELPGWQTALDSGMLDLVRQGRKAEAKELLDQCLSSSSD